ncbi:MAG: DUF1501 domain-containing protein [Planctomycetaceae bacterium]
MLNLLCDPLRLRRMMTRRDSMRAGFLGLGGLTLAELLRHRASAATNGVAENKDTAVILLFVHGGPSHLETYDLKPNAPTDIRGPFSPIPTNVPGLDVCELLPRHAQVADKYTIIRSVSHDQANHFEGHARFLSGYGQMKVGTSESHYPMVGPVVNRVLENKHRGMPAAVAINGVCVNGPDYSPGIAQGYWSSQYRLPICNFSLRDASLTVDSRKLDDRLSLQRSFDSLRRGLDQGGSMDALDAFNRRAIDILTTGKAQKAFDISQEDPKLRDKYGDDYFGREVLLARRLVESGVSFVSIRVPGSGPNSKAYDWDDHAVNWDMPTAMVARTPRYDHVVTTLIEDLFARGLDQKVLLIVTGEFGRTPRLEFKEGRIGRDHYPGAMSILVSGGGMPMGQVLGQTNRFGEHPVDLQHDPHDILATIYKHLGIDHTQEFLDPQGRPVPLTRGTPIRELI